MKLLKIFVPVLILVVHFSSVSAETFSYNDNRIIVGSLHTVIAQPEDTFISIGQEFALGYEEIVAANPDLDPWVPGEGRLIKLPKQFILPSANYEGIYINLAEMRIYYYLPRAEDEHIVQTYPISIGRGDWLTPRADAKVIEKLVAPTWYPPASVKREHELAGDPLPASVPPGDDNPLGKYALQLDLPGYFIHGTNRPEGIGMRVTHGCIRMRTADIETLFDKVPRGTSVTIQYKPFKVAIISDVAYLEAHGRDDPSIMANYLGDAIRELSELLVTNPVAIDWEYLVQVAKEARGIPTVISLGKKQQPQFTALERKFLNSDSEKYSSQKYIF